MLSCSWLAWLVCPSGCGSTCRAFIISQLLGSLQVYVTVYADGPTRVLRFADERSVAFLESEQSIIDLAARLNQVCAGVVCVSHTINDVRPGFPSLHECDRPTLAELIMLSDPHQNDL